ncbi:MAG: hypothetical protein IOC41_20705 [Burkholderia sp.]|uniref:hypothetical protein n=1 Tax=Burkholderia sp. TaxID=36773 RepID=UPI00258BEF2F|nr:hypothetical protein [Burkholderia sp.]MCA3875692.1 hypothetical protein [Burkholderia sp.]
MPTVDASKNVLTAAAGYEVGDWASVGAQASLDAQAVAAFSRGLDLQLGAEAIVRLDGAISEYLAADLNAQAHAAVRVRAQVQVPLDLFDEAGLAIRLQAMAEASAGVTLAVGLQVGDFLQLAGADPRMRGIPLELLKAFLAEFSIQGGVMAKASAAAMAYANLAMTGRLVPKGTEKPGFTVAAEAGVGLKAGAGFRVLARFGVDDPRRWYRRSVDVAVDASIAALRPALSGAPRSIVEELRVPAKIALRTAYEVGAALAESGGNFASGDGPKLSLRCVQVALEEVQRHVLEAAVSLALDRIEAELRRLGNANHSRWQAAQVQRQALAAKLVAMPEYLFDASQENLAYWIDLIGETTALALALVQRSTVPQSLARPLSILWCAIQLAAITLRRISSAQSRASLLGQPTAQATRAFEGDLPNAPDDVRTHVNGALGNAAGDRLRQPQALDFLVRTLAGELDALGPGVADVVALVAGPNAGGATAALSLVLSNIGAFVPDAGGTVRATTTLNVLKEALRAFFDQRVETELRPALLELAGDSREAALFADEALLGSLRTVVHVLFDRVLAWESAQPVAQKTVRELCSALVLGLVGRSLVVCGDVLLVKALQSMQGELRVVANRVNDPDGVAKTLSDLTGLDRPFLAEVIEEVLLVCADAFEPMPAERRARLRGLLYETIDVGAGLSLDELGRNDFVPNLSSAQELALLLGEEIAGNIVRFVQALLARVSALILESLAELIEDLQREVGRWVDGLVGLVQDLSEQLVRLAADIEALGRELDQAVDELLGRLSSLLRRLSDHQGSRTALRNVARDIAVDEALGVLRSVDLYRNLPKEARAFARDRLRGAVEAAINTGIFDFVLEAFAAAAEETADFIDDIAAIEPGDDIEQAVIDLFLDRIEDAIEDAFGRDNPRLELAIDVAGIHISLGRVRVPLSGLVTAIRQKVRTLQGVRTRVSAVAEQLVAVFEKEAGLAAALAEEATVRDEEARAQVHLAQSRRGPATVEVVQPAPGAALHGNVYLEVVVRGVNRTILDVEPPGQQRVFLWLNQRLLALEHADVSGVGLPETLRPIPTSMPALGASIAPEFPGARIVTRAIALDARGGAKPARRAPKGRALSAVNTSPPMLARPRGPLLARTTRLGGKTLPPTPSQSSPLGIGRNIRPTDVRRDVQDGKEGIRMAWRIPASELTEGINTVTIVVMPGTAAQRVEHSTSFLWRPARQLDGRLVAPERLTIDDNVLPGFARNTAKKHLQLSGRAQLTMHALAGSSPRPWSRATDRKGRVYDAGFPTRAMRAEAAKASRDELAERVAASTRAIAALREAVRKGALRARPAVASTATSARKGDRDGDAT